MRQLSAEQWQRLLQGLHECHVSQGDRIVAAGSAADCCYVIESGQAVVCRASQILRRLHPGDFFGEDALVLNEVRNADVIAVSELRLHRLSKAVFVDVLLKALVQFVTARSAVGGVMLNVGHEPVTKAVPVSLTLLREQISGFDPRLDYYIAGGLADERALCAFLLAQRGLRAFPLI